MQVHFPTERFPYILGLDLGATSLGWAVIETANGAPIAIRKCGVRIFEAGVEGSIEQGKDASRAAARRGARLARRQLWRRARRTRKVFIALQKLDLLPPSEANDSAARHEVLHQLDQQLRDKFPITDAPGSAHVLPYQLRAKAATEPVERHELGRALYHLAQRRGYLSNRKAAEKTDEEEGVVKQGIGELAAKLEGRTLGQYFATLDPLEQRIRQRWTAREMYLNEFNRIWITQADALKLTDEDRKIVYQAIFFQRPLKSQKGLVGKCELEPGRRRAPLALPIAQEFRILQTVNHLRVRFPNGELRELTIDEKQSLYEKLQTVSELSLAEARKRLGFKQKGTQFTLEESGEKKILGNRTRAKLEPLFGERWAAMTDAERDHLVLEVLHFQKPSALERRAIKAWGLSREDAERLSEVRLEAAYARHSVPAMEKLVNKMSDGLAYSNARQAAYPESFEAGDPVDELPPVTKAKPDLRNPAVCRALTELRKVVNALIKRYGKPEKIRIELARDLKKSRKERQHATDRIREQTKRREAAVQRIIATLPNFAAKRGFDPAVEKVLLAEECNWRCPFTDKTISMADLIGANPQFDVAHIYPRRYLDDSYANKTLCYHEVNRHRMHDLLPYQAFGSNTEAKGGVLAWKNILSNVRTFQGTAARIKLERFEREDVPDDFVSSQLNDTRYNSVVAAEYLGWLYGGQWDREGVRRIEPITGGITALLRTCWGLFKSRDNHTHHALDAIVLALTYRKHVDALSELAKIASAKGQRLTKVEGFEPPWTGFQQQVQQQLDEINISFRMDHRLQGALHAATNYSQPLPKADGTPGHRVRKQLHKLSETELKEGRIVDPEIRRIVQEAYEQRGGGNPAKVFAEPADHPKLKTKDGRFIPIHKVRIFDSAKAVAIGRGPSLRYVDSGKNTNHHVVVYAELDESKKETRWKGTLIDRRDAAARVKEGIVIQHDFGPNTRFKFSLFGGDCIRMIDESGIEQLYLIKNISESKGSPNIELRLHTDARDRDDIRKQKARLEIRSWDGLRKKRAFKVVVSPLGDWIPVRE